MEKINKNEIKIEQQNKNGIKGKSDVLLIVAVIAAIIGIVVFSGCIGESQEKQNITGNLTEKQTMTFTDDLNRTVEISKNPERIVAIATADVEILFLLNASEKLVGRPNFQKYPPEALKIDEIGGMYPMNLEKIIAKNPDLIIVTMTFKEEHIKQVAQLESYNLTVVGFNYPNTMNDIINHIKITGEVIGKENEADNLVKNLTFRISKITKITNKLNESQKPTVYKEWINKGGGKGSTIGKDSRDDNLIKMAGGKNIFRDVEKSYFEANTEEIVNKNPSVIIITADLDKFKPDELKKAIKSRPGWKNIGAVKNDRICVIESQITWANPRLIQGLEKFAKCIHPELFGTENVPNETKKTKTFTDDLNRTVEIPKNPERIVALTDGEVEILFALNSSDKIVGRSQYLRYPEEALKITDCGSATNPNFEVILNQNPDVIILTWIKGTYLDNVKRFEGYNVTVLGFDWPNTIDGLIDYIEKIGIISGKEKETEKLIKNMTTGIEKITNITSKLNESQKPGVFIEMRYTKGKKEIKTFGRKANLKTQLVESAGGKNVFAEDVEGFDVSSEEVIKKNPEVIIIAVSVSTFNPDEFDELKKELKDRPGWSGIDAVKNDRICVISSSLASTNPRIVQGLEEFAKCIHPELFKNGK